MPDEEVGWNRQTPTKRSFWRNPEIPNHSILDLIRRLRQETPQAAPPRMA